MFDLVISLSHVILLLSFVVIPLIILRKMKAAKTKYVNVKFIFYVFFICALLSVFCAFWKDYSSEILLRNYNAYVFNPDSGGEQVEYNKVTSENIERVKQLEKTIMGIGWPLKAIFIFTFSIIPVFVLTYLINGVIEIIIHRERKLERIRSENKN